MTEIPVAVEGEDGGGSDGRYVEPGALVLPIGAVPVTMYVDGEKSLVGKALGFRREGDVVYATIDLEEGLPPLDHMNPVVEIGDVALDGKRVRAGRLRAVHLTTGLASWHEKMGRP